MVWTMCAPWTVERSLLVSVNIVHLGLSWPPLVPSVLRFVLWCCVGSSGHSVSLSSLTPGDHTFVVRTYGCGQVVGSATATVTVPGTLRSTFLLVVHVGKPPW